ncbi:MAG: hypothetical protein CM15mP83_9200 [Flavobacteriaceae bacterium]|nr:MAG: hypothetical protein CM15mP83_9200 [Flavobacteriaceae bacterium]
MTAWIATYLKIINQKRVHPPTTRSSFFAKKQAEELHLYLNKSTIDGNRCQTNLSKYTDNRHCLYVWGSIHWCFTLLFFLLRPMDCCLFIGNIQLAHAIDWLWDSSDHHSILQLISGQGMQQRFMYSVILFHC